MPAWGGTLSEQQIWTVVAGIVSLRHANGYAAPETQMPSH
jgi:mono/diheme cytochrome c family protein